MIQRPTVRLAAALAPALLVLLPAGAADPPKGELWETTSQVTMDGYNVPIPPNTVRVCAEPDWTQPPGAMEPEQGCRFANLQQTASKMSWTLVCDGPMKMSGTGEFTRQGKDAYTGLMKIKTDQGSMTIKVSGRRLGSCDKPR